jgi:hypothetical protein
LTIFDPFDLAQDKFAIFRGNLCFFPFGYAQGKLWQRIVARLLSSLWFSVPSALLRACFVANLERFGQDFSGGVAEVAGDVAFRAHA